MAKRTNIVRIITNEIEKGNLYITESGNLVSEEMVTSGIKAEFIKGLNAGDIPMTVSLEDYKKQTLGNMKQASELLTLINKWFNPAPAEDTVEGTDTE